MQHTDFYDFVRFTFFANGDDAPGIPVVTFYIQKDVFSDFNSFLFIFLIEILELVIRKPIANVLKNQLWIRFISFSCWGLIIFCHCDQSHSFVWGRCEILFSPLFDLSKLGKLKTQTGTQDQAMSVGCPLGSHDCGAGVGHTYTKSYF